MKRIVLLAILSLFCAAAAAAADEAPRPENFQVLPQTSTLAPAITPYLNYQVNIAGNRTTFAESRFEQIRDENELLRVQRELREKLLAMLGGLPSVKTSLRPQITGRIQMDGFHIEKVIYESLPKIYVTALLYVLDDGKKHPGIPFLAVIPRPAKLSIKRSPSDW